jgi:hypothetical protein
MKAKRFAKQTRWVRSSSSKNTYICPVDVDPNSSEEELKRRCVNESYNPNNS